METVDFKELVLDGSERRPVESREKKKPVFEVVANSGADFAIRRTVGDARRLLVMLVSQNQYYIKNERTGEVAMLDYKKLTAFMNGCSTIRIGCIWLDELSNQKKKRELLVEIIRKDGFKETASSGLWKLDFRAEQSSYIRPDRTFDHYASIVKESGILVKHVAGICEQTPSQSRELIVESLGAFNAVRCAYSLDKAKDFIERFSKTSSCQPLLADAFGDLLNIHKGRGGIVLSRRYLGTSHIASSVTQNYATGEILSFNYCRFTEYLFDQSTQEGFGQELNEWAVLWKDAILMQIAIYGKVVDKYPKNLLSTHHKLVARMNVLDAELKKGMWAGIGEALRDYDWAPVDEELMITHPASPEEVQAEGRMQGNCVSSYINSIVEGRAAILFCRKKSDPEQSYLTIEISTKHPELKQIKARFNQEASDEDMRFIARWCHERSIGLGRYAQRINKLPA